MQSAVGRLRRHAVSQSLFRPRSLPSAIERLGFVQADPIRAPARAQDLILRLRVEGYRAGDLERQYGALDVEEDMFYVYGFLPRATWQLLHPRSFNALPELQARILHAFQAEGSLPPREVADRFGLERGTNAWGGASRSTQMALDDLHARGLLRVARREKGNRIYEIARPPTEVLPTEERLRKLAMVVASLLAPIPRTTFSQVLTRSRRLMAVAAPAVTTVISELLQTGALEQETVDGVPYLWPRGEVDIDEPEQRVRILAPFDPVVWDRRRFEHLWGWRYRFEAYTPAVKRTLGYYAMPLMWGDSMAGWANLAVKGGRLDVELGFVNGRPSGREFDVALDDEIARLEAFLGLENAGTAGAQL